MTSVPWGSDHAGASSSPKPFKVPLVISNAASTWPVRPTIQQRQKARDATAIGAPTAIARSLILQSFQLFYRAPVKLFRPLRVDYLAVARAIMPVNTTNKRFSLRYSSLGVLTYAIKAKGWSFVPKQILPPLVANTLIGTILYTTYIVSLPIFHPPSSISHHRTFPPPPFTATFAAGCVAGAAQSVLATPIDSLKARFEINDLLEGKHKSMWSYAWRTLRELGWTNAYRGFSLVILRDSLACGLFFSTFEWVKQQGYYHFLTEAYDMHIRREEDLEGVTPVEQPIPRQPWHHDPRAVAIAEKAQHRDKPPYVLEPFFIIIAGASAAVAYQLVDYPFAKIHNIFYIREAESEYANPKSWKATRHLYHETLRAVKLQVQRQAGGQWLKWLYSGFGATVLNVVPATSLGFLVFEFFKRELDRT
ncbi:hypothetical protein BZG36_04698 [Bifiguratus adelaidae]|uniref:Mitochondrial carrier protein n=1 Tax=Bifiguratus adelaidae TaxID=1938954 RepID=A0A261XV90_9FUNG|nr:hypothetical protein BZG36_04698 [Bifiguratus adelaidae]